MTWIQWCLLVPWMPWSCALELRSNVTQPQAQVTQPEPLDLAPQTAMKLLVPRHFTHMSPHEAQFVVVRCMMVRIHIHI